MLKALEVLVRTPGCSTGLRAAMSASARACSASLFSGASGWTSRRMASGPFSGCQRTKRAKPPSSTSGVAPLSTARNSSRSDRGGRRVESP